MNTGLIRPQSVFAAAVAVAVAAVLLGTPANATDVVVIPNGATGYRFTTYAVDQEPVDWASPTFDEAGLVDGTMPFGTGLPGGSCPIQASVRTFWPTPSTLLARRTFNLPPGASGVKVIFSVDNDAKIAINGNVLADWVLHEGCPFFDDFTYDVPAQFLQPGANLLAVLGRERHVESYLDLRLTRQPLPPVADAGPDQSVTEGAVVQLDGTGSSDPDGDLAGFAWVQTGGPAVVITGDATARPTFIAPEVGPSGIDLTFQLTVNDATNLTDTDDVTIHVMNTFDPPSCDAATAIPNTLWPPNHRFVPITLFVPNPSGTPLTVITGVTQDEPVNGLGDGDTGPDALPVGPGVVMLRAERSGRGNQPGDGNGRVYRIEFTATGSGGSCTGTATVCVPHDQGNEPNCLDDGLIFNSLVP